MPAIEINSENFKSEVLESTTPVLVDFWAPWCGPCRIVGPVMYEIAAEAKDVKVCKVNVDENPQLAAEFGVRSIPLVIVIKDGENVAQSLGAQPKEAYLELLKPYRP